MRGRKRFRLFSPGDSNKMYVSGQLAKATSLDHDPLSTMILSRP